MRISVLDSEKDNAPQEYEVSWQDLIEGLRKVRVTDCQPCTSITRLPSGERNSNKCVHRKGRAWSPSTFAEFDDTARGDDHVTGAGCLTFDVDHVKQADALALFGRIDAAGVACCVHSTHSDDPAHDDRCYRVIFPTTRQLTRDEILPTREVIAARLDLQWDRVTRNLERIYFDPSAPKGSEYVFLITDGAAIEPAAPVFNTIGGSPTRGGSDSPLAPSIAPVLDVDLSELRKRLKPTGTTETDQLMRRVLSGEVLAKSGHRDEALQKVTGRIAWGIPGAPLEAMVEILRESVVAMDPPEVGTWLEEARTKLERSTDRYNEVQAVKAQQRRITDTALGRESARASPEPQEIEALAAGEDLGPFDHARVEGWAAQHGCTVEEFKKRWIIRLSGGNWIFCTGHYRSCVPDSDLIPAVLRDLSRASDFVNLFVDDEKGNPRVKSLRDIQIDFTTSARQGRASLSLQESYYDPVDECFNEAVCPVRKVLKPRYHAEVDQWLTLMGGDPLLDWIACVTDLQHQAAAVYLEGPKGTGKNVLATGLARIWHKGAPTEYGDVVSSNFNDSLCRCPLIYADEGLPKSDDVGKALRNLIGSASRSLNRKFMPVVSLDGNVRLIISANNADGLSMNERLGQRDVDAISERLLHVDTPQISADYLKEFCNTHGQDYIKSWVEGDLIAQHALWLRDNRTVQRHKRFLGSGVTAGFHERLMTSTGIVSLVLEFLARCLSAVQTPSSKRLAAGGGRLLVNTELIADANTFKMYSNSMRPPPTPEISNALKQCSTGVEYREGMTYNVINVPMFLRWAETNGVGERALMLERIGHE